MDEWMDGWRQVRRERRSVLVLVLGRTVSGVVVWLMGEGDGGGDDDDDDDDVVVVVGLSEEDAMMSTHRMTGLVSSRRCYRACHRRRSSRVRDVTSTYYYL